MKQLLFTLVTLLVTLVATADALPASESKEVQAKDVSLKTDVADIADIAESEDNYPHEVERRAVSACKNSSLLLCI